MRNLVQQLEKENWVCELWEKYFRDSFELIPKTHFSSPSHSASSPVTPTAAMLAPCPSSFSSFLLPHQPFYCWTRSVWTLQEQPSRLSTPSHLQQEVAQAAACNSAQDFVWVTYIMAPWKKSNSNSTFLLFSPRFPFCLFFSSAKYNLFQSAL